MVGPVVDAILHRSTAAKLAATLTALERWAVRQVCTKLFRSFSRAELGEWTLMGIEQVSPESGAIVACEFSSFVGKVAVAGDQDLVAIWQSHEDRIIDVINETFPLFPKQLVLRFEERGGAQSFAEKVADLRKESPAQTTFALVCRVEGKMTTFEITLDTRAYESLKRMATELPEHLERILRIPEITVPLEIKRSVSLARLKPSGSFTMAQPLLAILRGPPGLTMFGRVIIRAAEDGFVLVLSIEEKNGNTEVRG